MENGLFNTGKVLMCASALFCMSGFAMASDSDDESDSEAVTIEMFAPGKNDNEILTNKVVFA